MKSDFLTLDVPKIHRKVNFSSDFVRPFLSKHKVLMVWTGSVWEFWMCILAYGMLLGTVLTEWKENFIRLVKRAKKGAEGGGGVNEVNRIFF